MRNPLRGLTRGMSSLLASFLLLPTIAHATNFPLPPSDESLIGNVEYISTGAGDTSTSIAQHYNIGLNAIADANPGVPDNTAFPSGFTLKISRQFLLPPGPRRGIVINLPEMRMYYYPNDSGEVMTFPIGIGRIGKTIPITNTAITRKTVNPVWIPPADIRKFNEEQGIQLPRVMPAGPDNPLGPYAIYLRIPTYLIHSTIFPESIGRRASFGCIRMNENDIKQFFPLVTAGTPVEIIDMPNKVAWNGDQLYLEAHPPLEERTNNHTLDGLVRTVENMLPRDQITFVNWQMLAYLSEQPDGVPHSIGFRVD